MNACKINLISAARTCALLAACSTLAACGTHSLLRSADVLPRGELELSGGAAVNTNGELLPVAQVAYGLTDRIELVGQYETYNGFGEARFQLLSTSRHGFAATVGLGAGTIASVNSNTAAATASLVVGRKFSSFDLYLGNRTFLLADYDDYVITSTKAGVSVPFGHFRLVVEGGAAFHSAGLTVGEGTAAIAVSF